MKLDAHQHFWKYNPTEYDWIGENMKTLKSDFLPADLLRNLNALDFDGSIAVQARQSLEETQWLLELAERYDYIKGIVGWVDLRSENLDAQLAEFGRSPKFIGVRHVIHDEPDIDFMLNKEFRRGINMLKSYELTYDLLLFPQHLPNAIRLVSEFPAQTFILDHISKPLIRQHILNPWNELMKELAQFPNVYCKLSGMVTEADWLNWKPEDLTPYLDLVYEAFGPERLMIGSDWPVCTVAGDYSRVMSLVIDYLGRFDESVRSKVLGANCAKVYLKQ